MGHPNKKALKIDVALTPDQIQWGQVLSLLISRFRVPSAVAKRKVRSFYGRSSRVLEPYWVGGRELNEVENQIVLCICEVHGADSISIRQEQPMRLGLRANFEQVLHFTPVFGGNKEEGKKGRCNTTMTAIVLSRSISLNSKLALALVRLSLLVFFVSIYVLLAGILLYGLAAFTAMMAMPVEGVIAATQNGTIGFALLCFLIGLAGLSGRIIRDVTKRFTKRGKAK